MTEKKIKLEYPVACCERCASQVEEGDSVKITKSTSDFQYCTVGKHYMRDSEPVVRMFGYRTSSIIRDPCNCGDHVRHNNGGNYHYRRFQMLVAEIDESYLH